MSKPESLPEIDEDAAETAALASIVAERRADKRSIPHEEVRAWLLRLASGDLTAEPPKSR